MKKNMATILLSIFVLTCSSCHKITNADKVPLKPKLSIGDEAEYVVENPPSTPPMSIETLQTILKVDYFENSGPIRESRTLIPIQLNGSVFEYLSDPYLNRFDILGHQKSEFIDVFKNVAWVNRNDEILLGEDENWIVGDDENYYYLEEFAASEKENYRLSFFLVCKNRTTFQVKWRIKIIDEDNVYVQRIVQNKDCIYVFTRSDLSLRCIDKKTSQVRWIFEAKKEIPNVNLPLTDHSNNSVLGLSKVRIIHQFGNYLVLHIYSYDIRSKTENPYMFTKNIEIDFLLSLDGKVIREISDAVPYSYEKPSPFHHELYFFQNDKEFGMKGIVDGQIRWKEKTASADPEMEEKEVTRNETDQKEVFYLSESYLIHRIMAREGEKVLSTISLLNYQDGKTVWTKSLPMITQRFIELKRKIYILGSERNMKPQYNNHITYWMVSIDPQKTIETRIELPYVSDWSDGGIDSYFRELISINDQVFLFFRNGFSIIESNRASFFSYPSAIDPVLRDYWSIPDYWNVTVKTYQDRILVVFTNDSEDSGGGYMVFKLLKQENKVPTSPEVP
jgi:hypothetical protein